MAKPKNNDQKAPAPGPAPSAEEMRRRHAETTGKDRLRQEVANLEELLGGNLKKTESLRALEQVGIKIVEIALQTRGRMRSSDGRGDAFLEATAANVRTALRHADKVMEGHDKEMGAWAEALEIAGPALEDLKRISKGLERPGVKVAIVPGGGDGLFDDEGQPTEKAVAPPTPAPAPEPPSAPEPEIPPPAPAHVAGREIPTLGMGPVVDVEPEPAHPFDGLDADAINNLVSKIFDQLEEAGVEEGLKRKDWKKPYEAWCAILPFINDLEDEDLPGLREAFLLLTFALETRKPISWAIPTEAEVNDHARKLAIAAGE